MASRSQQHVANTSTAAQPHVQMADKPENPPRKPTAEEVAYWEEVKRLQEDTDNNSLDEDYDAEHVSEIRRRRLWRLLCTPPVTVLVGPSERCFHLHRGLLRRHSLFFRSMLRNDRFPEGKTQVVKLPEDDVTSFATFAEWLYVGDACETGAIFKDAHGKNVTENDDEFLGAIQDDVFDNKRKQRMVNEEKHMERRYPADETTGTSVRRLPNGTTEAVTDIQANENADGEERPDAAEEDGEEEEEGEKLWETGSLVDSNADYDHFDFSLQFSCYVLADKLQAFGFKQHILDEIHYFGEFCESSHLTVDQIRYVYANTSSKLIRCGNFVSY